MRTVAAMLLRSRSNRPRTAALALLACGAVSACSQPPAPGGGPSPSAAPPVAATADTRAVARGSMDEADDDLVIPTEKFSEPEKAFAAAKSAMLTKYYASGLTEEDLYRAAVSGMLRDVDPAMRRWNRLLSPRELTELTSDLKGELVGIGVRVKFDRPTGHIQVLAVIPGSPAEKAGMRASDLILSVNGKLFKGKSEQLAIQEIRGKAGEPVALSVLRDDKIVPFSIPRAKVALDEVRHQVWNGVGYAAVHLFSERTTPALKSALDDFATAHVTAVALDLRENTGGSFEEAVKCAELLLPAGAPIVTLEHRDGKTETFLSKAAAPVTAASVPIVVLVDHNTSSGAELVAAALAEGRQARTVGTRTFGKWSVQAIEELGNGYAIKFTSALFHAPSGKTYQGVGLPPDVQVDEDEDQVDRAGEIADLAARLPVDPQLRTALALVSSR